MPREMNDVIPPGGKRSIRSVPVPPRAHRWSASDESESEDVSAPIRPLSSPSVGGKAGKRWVLWTVVALALVVLILAVFFSVSSANVVVTLKKVPVTLSDFKGTALSATTTVGSYVPYREVVVEGVEEAKLEPEGNRHVERKASGTIIVYNNYSSASQRLIKNTRFETPDGFIYRIPESIVVPGQKIDGGRIIPGSVETVVYADQPGASYNIALTDFTVPGFKGSPDRFAGFYARSKTAMTGGFVGTAPFVSPEKLAGARAALRAALQEKLIQEAQEQAGTDAHIFPTGFAVEFTAVPEEKRDSTLFVAERATLTAFAFSRTELSSYIAMRAILRYDGAPVLFENIETLSFEFLNKSDFGKGAGGTILFALNGAGDVVWTLDYAALARALAGKPQGGAVAVISTFPAIERSQVVVHPFWRNTFPDNPARIHVMTGEESERN